MIKDQAEKQCRAGDHRDRRHFKCYYSFGNDTRNSGVLQPGGCDEGRMNLLICVGACMLCLVKFAHESGTGTRVTDSIMIEGEMVVDSRVKVEMYSVFKTSTWQGLRNQQIKYINERRIFVLAFY